MTRARILAAVAVAAMLGTAGLCVAQSEGESADERLPVFTDLVEVNVVNLFVYVTDRDGNPVPGLGPDDFEVFEDGNAVEITNFEAVEPERPPEAAVDATEPSAPQAAEPASGSTAGQRRYLAVLFDNPSLRRRDRRRVIEELGPAIDRLMEGGAEVLVATADAELEVVEGFTTSPSEVHSALAKVSESRSDGDALMTRKRVLERDIYRARVVDPRTPGFSQVQAQRFLTQIEAFRAQERARVETALDHLGELVRTLGGVGGRTTVLWVGEDLPLQPATDLYQLLYARFSGEATLDQPQLWGTEIEVVPNVRNVTEIAQGGAISVSFLDAADPDREEGNADVGAPDILSAVAAEGGNSVSSMGMDLARRRSATEGESFIAGETGGEMLAGSRNLGPFLNRIVNMMETYYSLGYSRPGEPDGKLHDVEVRVQRPHVTVRTQNRVRTVSPDERLADVALARLQLDAGGNDLGVALRLGERRLAEGRRKASVYDVSISVPVRSLVVVPVEGGAVVQLMVAVRILDPNGVASQAQIDRGPVAVPSGASQVEFSLPLMIPNGTSRIAVAVRDELSGGIGSATVQLSD